MQSQNSNARHDAELLPSKEQEQLIALWGLLMLELRNKLQQTNTPSTKLTEILPQEFMLTCGDGMLSVWLHPETGHGSWNCIHPKLDMAEPWFATPSGQIKLDGETMNISTTADRFIAKVLGKWTGPVMA